MTVAPEPTPTPHTQNPAPPAAPQQAPRPDLRLVPPSAVPPETDAEKTGPIPVIDAEAPAPADRPADQAADEQPTVSPQAPLDVRLLEGLGEILAARPRWSERSPSSAEAFEYSTSGDWTTEDKSAKRMFHGLCVLIAFGLTYPIDWAIQIARCKPIGFVLGLALLFVITKAL